MNNSNYYRQQSQVQQPPPQQQQPASSLHGFPTGQMSVQQIQEIQGKMTAQDYSRKQQHPQQLSHQPRPLNLQQQQQQQQPFGVAHSTANPGPPNGPSTASRPGSVAPGAAVNGVVNGHINHLQGGTLDQHHQFVPSGPMQPGQAGAHPQHGVQPGHLEHQSQLGGYQQQYPPRAGLPPGQGNVHSVHGSQGVPMVNGNMSIPQRPSQHHPAPLQGNQTPSIAQMRRGGSVNISTGPVSPITNRTGNNSIPPSDFGVQHSTGFPYNANTRGQQGMSQGVSVPGVNGSMGHVPMSGQPQNPHPPPTQLPMQMRTNPAAIANGIPVPNPQQPQRTGIRVPSQVGANPALMGRTVGSPHMNGTTLPNAAPGVPHPMATRSSSMGPPYLNGPSSQPGHSQPQIVHPAGPSSVPSTSVSTFPGAPPLGAQTSVPVIGGPPSAANQPTSLIHQLLEIQREARQHQIQQQTQPVPSAPPLDPTQASEKEPADVQAEGSKSRKPRPSDAPPAAIAQTLARVNPALRTVSQAVTNVRVLPFASDSSDVTHGGALPHLSEKDVEQMKEVTKKDADYEVLWRETRDRMNNEMDQVVGGKVKWWERDSTAPDSIEERTRLEIVWPDQSRQLREKRRERKEIRLPRPNRAALRRPEELVPIRIEIEHENHRLREAFVWNLNDPVVTPEVFAQATCMDLDLPHYFTSQFTSQLKQQLSEYTSHKLEYPSPADLDESKVKTKTPLLTGRLDPEDEAWWSRWRKRLRVSEDGTHSGVRPELSQDSSCSETVPFDPAPSDDDDEERKRRIPLIGEKLTWNLPQAEDLFDADTSLTSIEDEDEMMGELRILIKLDITVGSINLSDQFEWDINDLDNSPELFARVYCCDLGLTGDFKTAIAHDIREQIYSYKKCLAVVGHPFDGSSVQDDDLKTVFLPAIKRTARTLEDADNHTPLLNYLSESEMERLEKEREKEIRRKKRQGRARTKALPDRDTVKTQRTLLGATEIHNGMPPPAVVSIGNRRAAAQAASATIASLAASENSDRPYGVMTPPIVPERLLPVQPVAPPQVKPAKPQKSIQLRAPTLPEDLLGARSKLSTTRPTPSTSLRPPAPARAPKSRTEGESTNQQRSSAGTPVKASSSRAPTAKEVADAKAKEIAEGLHPCMINGKWHCSVCGCPEEIAIGRRKGPLGEKTMCGDCGKFYHRHRRPNDQVEYNTDPAYHSTKRRSTEELRRIKKKGMGRASHAAPVPLPDALNSRGDSPLSDEDDEEEDEDVPLASRRSKQPSVNRIQSPDLSDLESNAGDTKPLIQVTAQIKEAKTSAVSEHPSSPPTETKPVVSPGQSSSPVMSRSLPNGVTPTVILSQSSPATPSPRIVRRLPGTRPLFPSNAPGWLQRCLEATRAQYPLDDFVALQRPLQPGADPTAPPEWRLKCIDCPGKLYTPGPAETLDNFIVHLKNRTHRNNVAKRQGEAKPSTVTAPASAGAFA